MRLLFTRYRRIISLIIVVIVALIISKIYIDMNKTWEDKVINSEEILKYGDSAVDFKTYITYLKKVSKDNEVSYSTIDLNFDGKKEIIIKYNDDKINRYAIISRYNGSKVHEVEEKIDLSSLKQDGLFRRNNSNYAFFTFDQDSLYSKLILYIDNNKYYYNQKEISREEFEKRVQNHLDSDYLNWNKII